MIKDIIVNLEHQIARDRARDFAISVAETFDAHVAGVAFAYAPDFPAYAMMEIPADIVAQMNAESEKAAQKTGFSGRVVSTPATNLLRPSMVSRTRSPLLPWSRK